MNLEQLREKLPGSGRRSYSVNSSEEYKKATEEFGNLITVYVASKMAEVSQQRIYNLMDQGKFTRIILYGVVHVAYGEFETWRMSPRTVGRPRTRAKENKPSLLPKEKI